MGSHFIPAIVNKSKREIVVAVLFMQDELELLRMDNLRDMKGAQ